MYLIQKLAGAVRGISRFDITFALYEKMAVTLPVQEGFFVVVCTNWGRGWLSCAMYSCP